MKRKIIEKVDIPAGIDCSFSGSFLICKKGAEEVKKEIHLPSVTIKIEENTVIFECLSGNKKDFNRISTNKAHILNLFAGLQEKFSYVLEICNVHFPMTVKLDKDKLLINNFLGEKTSRVAKILNGAVLDIKPPKITVTSSNIEVAGQTAANIEKATKVKKRDRRIFQDGIFIIEKPERLKNV